MASFMVNVSFVTLVDLSGTSGQNLYSRQVAEALHRNEKTSLSIVCPRPSKDPPGFLSFDEIDVKYITEKRSRDVNWHLQIQLEILQQLRALHQTNNIEGIVTSLKPSLLVPPLFSFLKRVPQILIVEGMLEKNIKKMAPFPGATVAARGIATINAMNSTHIFAAYEEAADWIQSRSSIADTSVEIFHHGVNVDRFTPISKKEACKQINIDIGENDYIIGYVGSFKKYHCIDTLLNAVNELDREIKVILVGDGPERKNIESLANDLDINVYFAGFIDHNEVNRYISSCDLMYGVVDPNHWGSPMKVFEYLSCERPVIATQDDSISFVASRDLGQLIQQPNTEAVKSAIKSLSALTEQEHRAMGMRGREYIIENRTWNKLAEKIVSEIEDNI